MSDYKPVIGLEIHVELKTRSKMFCQCSADYFGKEPNINTCPVCLGMPGALPVPNRQAVEWTIKIGQALNCTINKHSKFDRKHYFYPDLPKGYQISQYDEPIAVNGHVILEGVKRPIESKDAITQHSSFQHDKKRFGIRRVHLEEDTGKLLHQGNDTMIDFNRSSVPLVEIVTEPDFDNSEDVKAFLEELHAIIRALEVSDANMEKGSMRMEPNISIRKPGETGFPPYKVEVKNINSFSYVKKAVDYELDRQKGIIEEGKIPAQETRGFNEAKGTTYSQRTKEEAHDYRYFPEPDIPPMEFTDEELENISKTRKELPQEKEDRYVHKGLKISDSFSLARNSSASVVLDTAIVYIESNPDISSIPNIYQGTANLILNKKIDYHKVSPSQIVNLAIENLKPKETDTELLTQVVETVIKNNPKVVEDYKSGKQNAIMFLVGQVMREMKGKADATIVRHTLENQLS